MPMGEGSPLHVLAAQPDVDAFLHEGAESHGLSQRPVHLALLHHLRKGYFNDIRIWWGGYKKYELRLREFAYNRDWG